MACVPTLAAAAVSTSIASTATIAAAVFTAASVANPVAAAVAFVAVAAPFAAASIAAAAEAAVALAAPTVAVAPIAAPAVAAIALSINSFAAAGLAAASLAADTCAIFAHYHIVDHVGAEGRGNRRGVRGKGRLHQGELAPRAAMLLAGVRAHRHSQGRQCDPHRGRNGCFGGGESSRMGCGGLADKIPRRDEQRAGYHH